LKDAPAVEFACGEDSVGERADSAMAAGQYGNVAKFRDVGEHFSGCVRRAGAKSCDFHCVEIVDVVVEETGLVKGDFELRGENA
jgi:hypothetical protein